jgi:outer membrane protein assembly factor BamA
MQPHRARTPAPTPTFATIVIALAFAVTTSAAHAQQPAPAPSPTPSEAPPVQIPEPAADGFVDKAKNWAEKTQIVERLNGDVDGWYPRLGGMTRGGGIAVGPGYRTHLGGSRVLVDLSAGISMKAYKAVDAKVRWVQAFNERFELWTNYRYEDFPQEDYFGPGFASSRSTRTSYGFESNEFSVRGLGQPLTWLRVGTTLGYLSPSIGRGSDKKHPSTEELFTDAEAPGLLVQPNFLHTTIFADIDYLDQRGHPRSGGFYHTSFGVWDDRTRQQFDFRRFDITMAQYVPLEATKKHVVSGHLGFSYVNNKTGGRVPFYFLAYVGGVDTIRSFREFRFKDENALWMNLEYNWALIEYLSLAAFVDAGKVSADWEDMDFTGLKKGYGFGLRAHTNKQTFARLDFATGGGEGWQIFLKVGPAF